MMIETEGGDGSERRIARNAQHINSAAKLARESTMKARTAASQMECVNADRTAIQKLIEAADLSYMAMNELLAAGAVISDRDLQHPRFDLCELAKLSTLASRGLLELLQLAQTVAEEVDAERGRTLPASIALQPGESRGTDLAESISELVLRLQIEVEGPKGSENSKSVDSQSPNPITAAYVSTLLENLLSDLSVIGGMIAEGIRDIDLHGSDADQLPCLQRLKTLIENFEMDVAALRKGRNY